MGELQLATCPACGGRGRVAINRCREYLQDDTRCRLPQRPPAYYEQHPEQESVRLFCALHGDARLRWWAEKAVIDQGPAVAGAGPDAG